MVHIGRYQFNLAILLYFHQTPIPGNTTSVNRVINELSEAGANVIHGKVNNIHTSGHGGQEEQKLMLRLMKPKFFMPIHGEYRMLKIHTELAQLCGVPKENCFIMENGDVLALTANSARYAGHFLQVMFTLTVMALVILVVQFYETGVFFLKKVLVVVVATIDLNKKQVKAGPDILSRGFVYMRESGKLISQTQHYAFNAIKHVLNSNDHPTEQMLRSAIIDSLQDFLFNKTERRPMILPMFIMI